RKVLTVELDIPNKAHIAQAVDAALTQFGRIDVLVNNVGVAPGNLAELVAEKDLDEILDVNIQGTFLMTQAVGRHLLQR
ncbi:SDR family NAD(P)-dependent oxidoreductase, partial [Rhizobium ruizarguesonis]